MDRLKPSPAWAGLQTDLLWETGWEGAKPEQPSGDAFHSHCHSWERTHLAQPGTPKMQLSNPQQVADLPLQSQRRSGCLAVGESALLKINSKICEMNHTLEVPICLHWLCRKPVQLIRFRHLAFKHLKTEERNPIAIDILHYWPDKGRQWERLPARFGANQAPVSSVHGNVQSLTSMSSPLEL